MKRWGTVTLMLFAFVVGFASTYSCGGGSNGNAQDYAPLVHTHDVSDVTGSGYVSVPFVPAWISIGEVKREYCFDSAPGDEYHHQVGGAYADSTFLWNGWMSAEADSTTYSKFYVPVQLPDGATITSFHVVAYDNDLAHDARIFFRRSEAVQGQNYRITGSTLYTSGASNIPEVFAAATINPDMALIDNSQYSYTLEAKLIGGSDVVLISAVVGYEFQ